MRFALLRCYAVPPFKEYLIPSNKIHETLLLYVPQKSLMKIQFFYFDQKNSCKYNSFILTKKRGSEIEL